MAIPTIYCDKKQALPGDVITVTATIGSGEWFFPNALSGDIVNISGDQLTPQELDNNTLTFKCLSIYDPLIVSFLVIEDTVINGSKWTDSFTDNILADNWVTPSGQETSILSGWNFEGRSQRVTQSLSGNNPSIMQEDLTVSGGEYTTELQYRAYSDIQLKVGGHVFDLVRTNEGPNFAIYPIQHEAGFIDFEATDGGNIKWLFADGSVSYDTSVAKNIIGGTSYLIMDDFVGQSIGSGNTDLSYIGSLSDIPSGLSILELDNTAVSGDIVEINHVQDVVSITNSENIEGNVSQLSTLTSVMDFEGCPNIYGNIGDLKTTDQIVLNATEVYGEVSVDALATSWKLNNTLLSKTQLENSIINLATSAVANDVEYGYFECYDNMPTVDSFPACTALTQLRNRFWTITIHESCTYN
jgi:hypothetical protein